MVGREGGTRLVLVAALCACLALFAVKGRDNLPGDTPVELLALREHGSRVESVLQAVQSLAASNSSNTSSTAIGGDFLKRIQSVTKRLSDIADAHESMAASIKAAITGKTAVKPQDAPTLLKSLAVTLDNVTERLETAAKSHKALIQKLIVVIKQDTASRNALANEVSTVITRLRASTKLGAKSLANRLSRFRAKLLANSLANRVKHVLETAKRAHAASVKIHRSLRRCCNSPRPRRPAPASDIPDDMRRSVLRHHRRLVRTVRAALRDFKSDIFGRGRRRRRCCRRRRRRRRYRRRRRCCRRRRRRRRYRRRRSSYRRRSASYMRQVMYAHRKLASDLDGILDSFQKDLNGSGSKQISSCCDAPRRPRRRRSRRGPSSRDLNRARRKVRSMEATLCCSERSSCCPSSSSDDDDDDLISPSSMTPTPDERSDSSSCSRQSRRCGKDYGRLARQLKGILREHRRRFG